MTSRIFRIGLALLPLAFALPGFGADASVEQRIQQIENGLTPPVLVVGETPAVKLSDQMAALKVPGVSIAVIHAGKIEWARGFGVTRIGGPPVTPRTLFQAASISKPVTALTVLHLVQAGTLNLDTDVNQYLKSWKVPANSLTAQHPVTLRDLLTHTAGMTVHGFAGYASDATLPTLVQVLDGEAPANSPAIRVDTVPGTIWRYSGGGYVVAQRVLEDVTGQPFAQLMQRTVLSPIGMSDSTYEQPLPRSRTNDVAIPYRGDGAPVKGGPHVYPEQAPAGLWTTPTDLARYAIEVQRSLAGKSNRVLNTAMVREMLTPGMNHQGLGPGINGSPAQPLFEHDGANEGYRCAFIAYESGDGAVIMTNSDSGGPLIDELRRTIAVVYGWPDFQPPVHRLAEVDPQHLDLLTGSYRLAPQFVLTITREGTQLLSQATGQGQIELFPDNEHEFFTRAFASTVTFEVDSQGRATSLVLHQNDRNAPGTRLDDATAKRITDELASTNKRFHDQTAAPGSEAALRQMWDGISTGNPDYSKLSPGLAALTRQQLPDLRKLLMGLGPISFVSFGGVRPGGADIYRVTYAQGTAVWSITLAADGTIAGADLQIGE
jgi:CubicO group peptidase (beta-lactamase class C family)